MKKNMFVTMLVAFSLLFCLPISVVGLSTDTDTDTYVFTVSPQLVGEINGQFYDLIEYFEEQELNENGYEYPSFYAGAYVTEGYSGLVVCVTDDSEYVTNIIRLGTGNPNVVIKKVQFSYNELLEAKENIKDVYIDSKNGANTDTISNINIDNIVSIGISVKNNALNLGIKGNTADFANASQNSSTPNRLNISDGYPPIIIVQGDYGDEQASYSPRDKISTTLGSSTMGNRGKLRKSSNDGYKKGFWMAGHAVANEGNSVNKGDGITYIGECIARKSSGKVDAAFVSLNNQDYDTVSSSVGNITLSDSSYYSAFLEDQIIYMYGSVSGLREGTVVDSSYSFTNEDGVGFSDFVKANYRSYNGDSGAVVYVRDGSTYKAAGLHYGIVDTSYKAFCKISNVYDEWDWQSWS